MAAARWKSLAAKLARDREGSVAVLAAIFGGCLIACLAISVDVGNIYLARRERQAALDIAALAAARDLSKADAAARLSLTQNHVAAPEKLTVVLGRYLADGAVAPSARFVAGAQPANAVRLEMVTDAPLVFGRSIIGAFKITTNSVAANTRVASFSVGSRLASVQAGVANALLSALTGGSVSLTAMDYQALADAKVDMPTLLSGVASRARLTAATYDDVLKASASTREVANALGDAPTVGFTAKQALQQIALAGGARRLSIGRMISFGPFGGLSLGSPVGSSVSASALETLMTSLAVANAGSQVDFDLGAQVPGLLGLTASVTIGERPQNSPWLALDREGATVRTAQTRLRLTAKVAGVLGIASLNLPVAVDVAMAEATLTSARCGRVPRTDVQATLAVTPGVGRVWIGEPDSRWNDLSKPAAVGSATLVDSLLLTAKTYAYAGAENPQPTSVTFKADDIEARTIKTVATTPILESTLSSLTRSLSIDVTLKLLGLGLGTPKSVADALGKALLPVGALLDPVLASLLDLLGVELGQADVTVRGLRCDGSALVG